MIGTPRVHWRTVVFLVGLALAATGAPGSWAAPAAPSVHLTDLDNRIVDPFAASSNAQAIAFIFASVSCPTLVCVGDLDPVTPVAAAQEIAAALPEGIATLEVIDCAGHFPWKDAPDRYWPLITEFVTTTAKAGADPGSQIWVARADAGASESA